MITAFQSDAFQQNAFQIEEEAEDAELAAFGAFLLGWKRRRIKKRHAQLAEVAEVVQQVVHAVAKESALSETPAAAVKPQASAQTDTPPWLRYEPAVIADQLLKTQTLDQLRQIKRADVMLKRIQDALDELDDEEILLLI